VVLSARLIGTVALVIPLAFAGRLRPPARVLPLVAASGVGEVLGFYLYTAGARHGIAIAAVLASQFATFSALGAYLLFGERLSRVQLAGVISVIIGVSLVSALHA
jgi:drug/metabolite transporter (DMT)-like permease